VLIATSAALLIRFEFALMQVGADDVRRVQWLGARKLI
jgi:hypothetical protein